MYPMVKTQLAEPSGNGFGHPVAVGSNALVAEVGDKRGEQLTTAGIQFRDSCQIQFRGRCSRSGLGQLRGAVPQHLELVRYATH